MLWSYDVWRDLYKQKMCMTMTWIVRKNIYIF